MPHEIPDLPWCKVGMDIMDFQEKSYLVVVDFYSHYPEIRIMRQKRGEDVIMALKSIFAAHGVPQEIVADNMPFNSYVMNQFASHWGFKITTSSPNYPKSNGLAERYVQTIKQFLRKTADSGEDLYESLLAYRQTPVTGLPFSPAEMLFGRNIRGPLPCTLSHLQPTAVKAHEKLSNRQDGYKAGYDKSAKSLEPLAEGDNVMVRTRKAERWQPARVVDVHPTPRSYIVDNGHNLVRRNRVHLKHAPVTPVADPMEPPLSDPLTPVTTAAEGNTAPSTPVPTTPKPAPRRSARQTRGTLPVRYDGFQMD